MGRTRFGGGCQGLQSFVVGGDLCLQFISSLIELPVFGLQGFFQLGMLPYQRLLLGGFVRQFVEFSTQSFVGLRFLEVD